MENFKLVLRGDLNQHGYLYGGNLLKWIDEYAWIAATLDFPESKFVTVAFDDVTFKKSIKEGSILKFNINKLKQATLQFNIMLMFFAITMCHENMDLVFSQHTLLL